jgi:hypothetical protein
MPAALAITPYILVGANARVTSSMCMQPCSDLKLGKISVQLRIKQHDPRAFNQFFPQKQ